MSTCTSSARVFDFFRTVNFDFYVFYLVIRNSTERAHYRHYWQGNARCWGVFVAQEREFLHGVQFMSAIMLFIEKWHRLSIRYCFAVDALRRTLESSLLQAG